MIQSNIKFQHHRFELPSSLTDSEWLNCHTLGKNICGSERKCFPQKIFTLQIAEGQDLKELLGVRAHFPSQKAELSESERELNLIFFSLRRSISKADCAKAEKIRAYFAQVVHVINDEGFSPVCVLSLRYELRLANLGLRW